MASFPDGPILGISAYYHDSAAAVLRGGDIVAAAQEERFTRKKHDARFPRHAIDYCLDEAGVSIDELAAIVFYDKPLLKFERLLETYLARAPRGFNSFRMAIPVNTSRSMRTATKPLRSVSTRWPFSNTPRAP